jgi:hypothetical protein
MSPTVKLDAGTLDAATGELSSGSMARAIGDAFEALLPPQPNEDLRVRRKLALAVAQGVIEHLAANAGAIVTTVPDTGSGSTHEQPATRIDHW